MLKQCCDVQTIALKLLQSCLEDGSPLVRRELVVALQWVLLTFIPNFINLLKALQVHHEQLFYFWKNCKASRYRI